MGERSERLKREVAVTRRRRKRSAVAVIVLLPMGILYALQIPQEFWYLRKLRSEHSEERMRAAYRLSVIRSTRAIPQLVDLLGDAPETPRLDLNYAGHALVRLGTPAVPALIEMVETGGEESKLLALKALGDMKSGAEQSVPHLVRRLDQDEGSRVEIVRALVEIGTTEAVQNVLPVLVDDLRSEKPRYGAMIARLGERAVPDRTNPSDAERSGERARYRL